MGTGGTPFVKEGGCHKMTCSVQECRNVQCYVCPENCDYSHFYDKTSGYQVGKCPLFENTEERHQMEVESAEQDVIREIMQEDQNGEHGNLQAMYRRNFQV